MKKHIYYAENPQVSMDSLLAAIKTDKDSDEYEDVAALYRKTHEIARPVVLYAVAEPEVCEVGVSLNGVIIKEPFVAKMLEDSKLAVPYVMTCGTEIDRWAATLTDVLEQYAADALKELFLYIIRDRFIKKMQETCFETGEKLHTLTPGLLAGWPLSGQVSIFEMLGGVTPHIGVTLSESFIMNPNKSMSGILFQSGQELDSCLLCPLMECHKCSFILSN
jgi:hypothetical protein